MTDVASAPPSVRGMLDPTRLGGTVRIRAIVSNDDVPRNLSVPNSQPAPVWGIDYSPIVLSERQWKACQQLMRPAAALANLWFNWVFDVGNALAPAWGLKPVPRGALTGLRPNTPSQLRSPFALEKWGG